MPPTTPVIIGPGTLSGVHTLSSLSPTVPFRCHESCLCSTSPLCTCSYPLCGLWLYLRTSPAMPRASLTRPLAFVQARSPAPPTGGPRGAAAGQCRLAPAAGRCHGACNAPWHDPSPDHDRDQKPGDREHGPQPYSAALMISPPLGPWCALSRQQPLSRVQRIRRGWKQLERKRYGLRLINIRRKTAPPEMNFQ